MQKKNDNQIYTQLQEFLQQFVYKHELGINIEMKEFLQNRAEIKDYSFAVDKNNHYLLKVFLEEFNSNMVKSIFTSFAIFLEYSGATIYTKEVRQDSIKYLFASFTQGGSGFYLEIEFRPFANCNIVP